MGSRRRLTLWGSSAGTAAAGGSWASISGELTTGTQWTTAGDEISTMAIGQGMTAGTVLMGSKYGRVLKSAMDDQASPALADITGDLPAFTRAAATGNAWITGLAVNRANNQEAWATVGQLGAKRVLYTTNAVGSTTTWSDLTGNLPAGVVDSILSDVSDPQTIYVGMDHGRDARDREGRIAGVGQRHGLALAVASLRKTR